jgi:hypothetical protein
MNQLRVRCGSQQGEEIMILRGVAAGLAGLMAVALLAGPALAQSRKGTDRTVITTRDEDGRTRTKIIVNRRSFLDPGTQVFPGEDRYNSGPALVYQPTFSSGADRGTVFDRGRPPLPDRFDLPFRDNPIGRPD